MTFLPFKAKNSIYSSNMHFISCDLEPQAVKQHIFGGLWQLKIKGRRHSIKFRWCMPQTAPISSVPGYGLMMGSNMPQQNVIKTRINMHFCITPYQTLSEWSWLGNLKMIAVAWWVSEILMRVSHAQGWIFWKNKGMGVWEPDWGVWQGSALPLLQDKEGGATVPAQAQSDTLGEQGAECGHKVVE